MSLNSPCQRPWRQPMVTRTITMSARVIEAGDSIRLHDDPAGPSRKRSLVVNWSTCS